MIDERQELLARNNKILELHNERVRRKQIALVMHMQYETVKKVIQKYQGIERRKIVRQNESYAPTFSHSDR